MLEWGKGELDAIGLILGVGEFADGINGVISLGRGDYVSAGLSFASMIPIIGDAVGKGCKKSHYRYGKSCHAFISCTCVRNNSG